MAEVVSARSARPEVWVAAWLAFAAALLLALPQPWKPGLLALGLAAGSVFVVLGSLAGSAIRPMAPLPARERMDRAALALLTGALLGAVLLAALIVLAHWEPALHARFAHRLTEPRWRPWAL